MNLIAFAVGPVVLGKDAFELESSPASNGFDGNVGAFNRIVGDYACNLRSNRDQRWAQISGNP